MGLWRGFVAAALRPPRLLSRRKLNKALADLTSDDSILTMWKPDGQPMSKPSQERSTRDRSQGPIIDARWYPVLQCTEYSVMVVAREQRRW